MAKDALASGNMNATEILAWAALNSVPEKQIYVTKWSPDYVNARYVWTFGDAA